MAFKVAGRLNDIPVGTMKHVEIENLEILLANVNGRIYAIDDRCGHMSAPLSRGTLIGTIVECPFHRAQFDVTNGKVIREPQLGGLVESVFAMSTLGKLTSAVKTYDLRSYELKIEEDVIKINI